MNKTILFSYIGNTDPMSTKNYHDGPLLHIIRNYKPDVVYLYLSKEMVDFHHNENRYRPFLDAMSTKIGKDFEVIYIEKPELDNPQIFDIYFNEIRKIFQEIKIKYPNDKIIANVSSGTPAMKSSIQTLIPFLGFEVVPIQVLTPEKGTHDTPKNVVIDYWELNEDNEVNSKRCVELSNLNLNYELKADLIRNLISKYDYMAAYDIAITLDDLINPKVVELLRVQKIRMALGFDDVLSSLKFVKRKELMYIEKKDSRNIYEYFLMWESQANNKAYGSFIVGMSPLIAAVQKAVLENYSRGKVKIDTSGKWESCILNDELQSIKDNFNRTNNYQNKYNSYELNYMIQKLSTVPSNIKMLCALLRSVENKARNTAAHQIVSVTRDSIIKDTGISPNDIKNTMWDLICELVPEVKASPAIYRNIYNSINNEIVRLIYDRN